MKETNETTAYRVTITLDSAELPVDEQARNALLTEFRLRVGHRLGIIRSSRGGFAILFTFWMIRTCSTSLSSHYEPPRTLGIKMWTLVEL